VGKLQPDQAHRNAPTELRQAMEILRDYGADAAIEKTNVKLGRKNADALMRIGQGKNETLWVVELRRRPTAATIVPMLAARDRDKTLLVADFLAPVVADKLREVGLPYVDLAGNAWLKTPDYLIWVQGKRPATVAKAARAQRAFTTGGLQVIFALLTNPDWAQLPTRTLAAMAGVANGTVAAALRDLEALGFIVGKRAGKRRLRNREVLLNKWTEGYVQRFQQTTLIDRYTTQAQAADWWKRLDNGHALLGGEPAAAEITRFLTPATITLYVEGNPAPLVLKNRLHRAADGEVFLRRKFWNFEVPDWTHGNLAPPVLIYADLLATDDARCIETARRIKDEYLVRRLED
jgi:hypothetical protein